MFHCFIPATTSKQEGTKTNTALPTHLGSIQVSEYNALIKRYSLNTFDRADPFGVVVGSTKVFWPYFSRYIRSFDEGSVPKDPVDSFYQKVVSDVLNLSEISGVSNEVRYDWNTPRSGLFVHVQTAGHLAGFAFYDQEVGWSCHPTFGLWFVYRAVIIFDADWMGPSPTLPEPVFDEQTKQEMKKWTEVANSERWQVRSTRLKLRDACPIGKDQYRYHGDCLSFFFPIEESSAEVIARVRLSQADPLYVVSCECEPSAGPASEEFSSTTLEQRAIRTAQQHSPP